MFRQPRVIQVNRDASTMVDGEPSGAVAAGLVPDWDSRLGPQAAQFRSRTFSDGFIRNTSLELLLGVDCEACLALAARRHCHDKHISEQEFDLVCNCNVQQNNYINCHRDVGDQRGHTLNIYDLERIKRNAGRSHLSIGSHRSLDRKHSKSKNIGVSNYLSKQLISYDPTNTLMQKIMKKLSNLKKIGGEAISKRHQNAVQLAEIPSGSSGSLKKLSMLSLVDKSQRRVNSQSCIYSSSGYHPKDGSKNSASTYANFSGNVDQCFDRLRDYNIGTDSGRRPQKMIKMRSFDNNDDFVTRNSPLESMKFSTLDNRSRCKSIRRQMSYNDFPSERFRDNRMSETWTRDDNTLESRSTRTDLVDDEARSFGDADVMMMGPHTAHAHCTCDSSRTSRIPSIFYDTQVRYNVIILSITKLFTK